MTDPTETARAVLEAAGRATEGPWNDEGTSVDDFDADCMMRMEWMPNGIPDDGDGDAVNSNHKADAAFIALSRTAAPALAQYALDASAEIERLREALEWAFPLAVMSMEDHRVARVKAGHKMTGTYRSGTTYVGIYQDEVDVIERHRDTLNAAIQARTALKDK